MSTVLPKAKLTEDVNVAAGNDPDQPPRGNIVRDADFARRLDLACDRFPAVPPKHRGRQTWILRELKEKFDISVSYETVSRWFAGETKPRPDKLAAVAELLQVDLSWLSLGVDLSVAPRERKIRNAMADGAVNIIAGLIQMDGGHPAFPTEDNPVVHMHAIIKGAKYDLHVSLGDLDGEKVRFKVPADYESVVVLGLIRRRLELEIVELTADIIEMYGLGRGDTIDVMIDQLEVRLRQIESFSQRL